MKRNIKIFWLILFLTMLADGFSQDTATYTADVSNSYVFWHSNIHKGTVLLKEGEVKVVDGKIVAGDFLLLMDSIKDADIDYDLMRKTLENTLRSEIFFDTKNYPLAEFSLYYIEKNKENEKYKVMGNLTVKGITNCVIFPATITVSPDKLLAVSDTFQINRFNWDITVYSKHDSTDNGGLFIADNIDLAVRLVAVRKKE